MNIYYISYISFEKYYLNCNFDYNVEVLTPKLLFSQSSLKYLSFTRKNIIQTIVYFYYTCHFFGRHATLYTTILNIEIDRTGIFSNGFTLHLLH